MPQPSVLTGYQDNLQRFIDMVNWHHRVFYGEEVAIAQDALDALQQHEDAL